MRGVKMKTSRYFGNFVSELRKENNLSQDKLSKLLNINRATLAKIELGETSPSIDLVTDFLNFFNIGFSDFEQFIQKSSIESKLSEAITNKDDLEKILKKVSEL